MREQKQALSIFIANQFPAFYRTDGEKFIQFVEAYYEWMEQENGILDLSTNIYNLRDIDLTIDEFVIYFREKYLANFDPNSFTNARRLVKHASELFGTKGTEQSIKLLFQLLYNQEINLYYPGDNVLRASDGKWFTPQYLEVTVSEKNKSFLYREIQGTTTGAKAFVESIVRKTIDNRIFDVLFLSNVRGQFEARERITQDGTILNSPIVLGSLIDIDITDGGANNSIGDVLTIYNGSGKGAKARVLSVESQTGRVNFVLNDGGSGYRMSSNVMVSDLVLVIDNLSGLNFTDFEQVQQRNQMIGVNSPAGNAVAYATIKGYDSGNTVVANGSILAANVTHVILNVESGNFANADTLRSTANVYTAVTANVANVYGTGTFLGYEGATDTIGLFNSNGTFYTNTALIWATSNTNAIVTDQKTGTGADFSIGSLTNEETVILWSDLTGGNNTANVPFETIYLSGNNSGLANGAYGFVKFPSGNVDTVLIDMLAFSSETVGTISSLAGVSTGENYNTDVFVVIYEPLVAGFDYRDLVIEITNPVGVFLINEELQQQVSTPGYILQLSGITGTFANGEGVLQTTSGAQGQIKAANATHISVTRIGSTAFTVGQVVTGYSSGATGNTQSNTASPTITFAKGIVKSANTSVVKVKPTSINTEFSLAFGITGATSNASANITYIYEDSTSLPMGFNANVEGNVVTANGVIARVAMIDSGFGYIDGETLQLQANGNPVVSTGIAEVDRSGRGEGFWRNTDGFLNSDKYIHDNDYYQAYSYEIQTGIPLSKYSALLKSSFHMAGTKLFGRVVKVSVLEDTELTTSSSIVIS